MSNPEGQQISLDREAMLKLITDAREESLRVDGFKVSDPISTSPIPPETPAQNSPVQSPRARRSAHTSPQT